MESVGDAPHRRNVSVKETFERNAPTWEHLRETVVVILRESDPTVYGSLRRGTEIKSFSLFSTSPLPFSKTVSNVFSRLFRGIPVYQIIRRILFVV